MPFVPVAKVGELKAGDLKAVEVDGIAMVIGRDGERYFAVQRQCVHQGGDLAEGIISRGHLICSHHGWRFATATGRHDTASDVCLMTFTVRIHGDAIEVDPSPRTIRGF